MNRKERAVCLTIRKHRLARKLSQEKLAELCGLSAKTISALETGARGSPIVARLAAMCTAMGIKLSDVFRETGL